MTAPLAGPAAPAPYDAPDPYLTDQIDVVRIARAAALRRRRAVEQRLDPGDDGEYRALVDELRAREAAIAARAAVTDPQHLPIERLRRAFRLSTTEVRVLLALTAFELETRLRDAARALAGDPTRVHPDVGMLTELIYTGRERRLVADELGSDGRLVRLALVRMDRMSDTAFALRRARVVERVVELLHGRDVLDRDVARHADLRPPVDRGALVVPPATFDEVAGLITAAVAAAAEGRFHPVVTLSGAEGAGRKALITAAATRLGLRVLRVRCASLPRDEAALRALAPALLREAVLWRALVLLDGADQLALDGAAALDEVLLGGNAMPIAAVIGRLTGRPPAMDRGVVLVEVAIPDDEAREALWCRALGDRGAPEVARGAAERYTLTPGVIEQAAASARARAEVRGGDGAVGAADVHEGLRSVLDAKLATLGSRITWRQRWDDLVLPDDSVAELREFIARVKHRRQVYTGWGFGRKVAKGLGLSALFAGPPGTGKTMVAGLLADELALDLYQIDLSKIVSKWIGETEKNLAELFDAAEAGHAILLFDEADSLFAKRTDVKSSVDRYANLEVNYLLQRMEAFAGISVLTTNNETAIDEAFKRRLSLRIEFPTPEPEERERLWRAMLPREAAVASDIDFALLADKFEMTGGYIKNAALRAAFFAADEGSPIAMRHLVRAARAEYQGMGKVFAQL